MFITDQLDLVSQPITIQGNGSVGIISFDLSDPALDTIAIDVTFNQPVTYLQTFGSNIGDITSLPKSNQFSDNSSRIITNDKLLISVANLTPNPLSVIATIRTSKSDATGHGHFDVNP